MKPGRELPTTPWKNVELVQCIRDASRQVPEGTILTANGESLVIADQ
jgi:hypothetical protein